MSSEGFGYEEEGAGTSSAGGGAEKQKEREIRHAGRLLLGVRRH